MSNFNGAEPKLKKMQSETIHHLNESRAIKEKIALLREKMRMLQEQFLRAKLTFEYRLFADKYGKNELE